MLSAPEAGLSPKTKSEVYVNERRSCSLTPADTLQFLAELERLKLWQTFGRLRMELNQFIQVERDFSSRSR